MRSLVRSRMATRTFAVLFAVAIVAGRPLGARAAVPQTMSFQGVLTDAGGVPVADGTYDLTFRIYASQTDPSPLWAETRTGVPVTGGVFSVTLGEVVPLALDFDAPYWLGVSVNGGAEMSRIALASSPYSLNAQQVRGANVFPATGNVGVGTLSPSLALDVHTWAYRVAKFESAVAGSWAEVDIVAAGLASNPALALWRQGSMTALLWSGPSGFHVRSGSYDALFVDQISGNVGIDTTDTPQRLTVAGAIALGNTSTPTPGTIRFTGADFEGYDGSTWKSLTASGGGGALPSGTAGATLRCVGGTTWNSATNLSNDGQRVTVGPGSATEALYVRGGRWNLDSTEGDVRIGDDAYRLNIGVATGGLGAGTVGFRVKGGVQRMVFGGGANEVLAVDSSGTVTVGVDPTVDGRVDVTGSAGTATIDMSQGGDAAVVLPTGSVSADETAQEAGIVHGAPNIGPPVPDAWAWTSVVSLDITVPGPGYVTAFGSACFEVVEDQTSGWTVDMGLGLQPNGSSPTTEVLVERPPYAGSGSPTVSVPASTQGVFKAFAAGTLTVYLVVRRHENSHSFTVMYPKLTLMYVPTAYGMVETPN